MLANARLRIGAPDCLAAKPLVDVQAGLGTIEADGVKQGHCSFSLARRVRLDALVVHLLGRKGGCDPMHRTCNVAKPPTVLAPPCGAQVDGRGPIPSHGPFTAPFLPHKPALEIRARAANHWP